MSRPCEHQERVVEYLGEAKVCKSRIYRNKRTGRVWLMPNPDPVEITMEQAKEMLMDG